MAEAFDVLIVGGGQGGAQAAVMLRQHGFSGTIAIVGEEPYAPYDRPPLSKEYLLGDKTFEKMLLQTPEAWADKRVDLLTGRRVVTVDAAAHEVRTADSACIRYGKLIWAAGGAARKLGCSGANLAGIHTVRNRTDVDQLLRELPSATSAVVIGGGYIGLEAAAALTKLGKRVTLLEALDRVLARVAGEPLSRFYEGEHRAKGVDVRLGVNVESLEGEGCVSGVRLTGGDLIAAELVIVGIGIVPEVGPLLDAGAKGAGSVRVDEFCRTSLPDVFAIGDCAEHRNSFAAGEWVRVESVQNANDQAATAAKAICGKEEPYTAAPWFWSNQYDLRLQTIGLSRGYDDLVIRGEPASRAFSIVYLRAGRVIALDCVNQVRDYTHGRALVLAGAAPDRARLADATIQLKTLLG